LKIVATKKAEQNRAMVDPWTFVHLASGLAAGLMGVRRDHAVAAAVLYEIVEQYVERREWGQEFFETTRPEDISNSVLDVLVFVVGHRLGEAWNDTR